MGNNPQCSGRAPRVLQLVWFWSARTWALICLLWLLAFIYPTFYLKYVNLIWELPKRFEPYVKLVAEKLWKKREVLWLRIALAYVSFVEFQIWSFGMQKFTCKGVNCITIKMSFSKSWHSVHQNLSPCNQKG